jgi:hypothetical protein
MEIQTSRIHRTWLDKLSLWQRAYRTKIIDEHREVVGRGPTPKASRVDAERDGSLSCQPKTNNRVERLSIPAPTQADAPATDFDLNFSVGHSLNKERFGGLRCFSRSVISSWPRWARAS